VAPDLPIVERRFDLVAATDVPADVLRRVELGMSGICHDPAFRYRRAHAIQRTAHVGIVVDDVAAATAFFVELGLEPQGQGQVRASG
jgi:catechol-2,3-dioxygenase